MEVLCHDRSNEDRIRAFRTRMKTLLRERINLTAVESVLGSGQDEVSADALNGFFACIAISRHAYRYSNCPFSISKVKARPNIKLIWKRWATIPVVKAAQLDKLISFPPELDIPWSHLQKRYGVTSAGGNVTSNYFCNFTADGTLVYEINHGMSDLIKTAEYNFAHIFPAMERLVSVLLSSLISDPIKSTLTPFSKRHFQYTSTLSPRPSPLPLVTSLPHSATCALSTPSSAFPSKSITTRSPTLKYPAAFG
jgi:hypothetical protein